MTHDDLLAHHLRPGPFTDLGPFAGAIGALPDDVPGLVEIVQGLLIHEGLVGAYGVTLSPGRAEEKQIHGAAALLAQARRHDPRSIAEPRPPGDRVVGVCRHFAVLLVAMLRAKGVPARARCGFAGYFAPGKHLDHWVAEYWNAAQGRWVLVDAQVDDVQRRLFGTSVDTLDVARDQFLMGGDAWRACRAGADPMSFGVAGTTMWGLVEVYGDLFQDLACLQNVEFLPWGWYGLALDESGMEDLELMDRLAGISSRADNVALVELMALVADDPRLRAPADRVAATVAAERDGVAASGLAS